MPLESFEFDAGDVTGSLTLANYSGSDATQETVTTLNYYLPHEKLLEGLALMVVGVVGIILNIIVLIFTLSCSNLRIMMNGFTLHGCFVDMFKSALCIPFALTLLNDTLPDYCEILGTTYVVMQTAGLFNLLAMVLAEAYNFHVHNLNEKDPDRQGAFMCVLFGIIMIYSGSVIIHLGPTLIGGHFKFNDDIGNCLFAYGEIKSYIVQSMWIGIVTLTFMIIFRYIYKFYRLLKANEQFRITALARNAAAMSKGESTSESIYDIVYRLKKKVKVLLAMSLITFICWYPLFVFTLTDLHYERPRYLYRILTVFAWSHSTLTPLPLLLIDRSFGCWFQFKRMMAKRREEEASPEVTRRLLSNQSRDSSAHPTPNHFPKKMQMVTNYSGNDRGNNNVRTSLINSTPQRSHWQSPSASPLLNHTPKLNHTSPKLNHNSPKLNHIKETSPQHTYPIVENHSERLPGFPTDPSDKRASFIGSSGGDYNPQRNSYTGANGYGSVRNSPAMSQRSGMLYDKLSAELHMIGASLPSPAGAGDTLEARVNQARETDLLFDASPTYDLL